MTAGSWVGFVTLSICFGFSGESRRLILWVNCVPEAGVEPAASVAITELLTLVLRLAALNLRYLNQMKFLSACHLSVAVPVLIAIRSGGSSYLLIFLEPRGPAETNKTK